MPSYLESYAVWDGLGPKRSSRCQASAKRHGLDLVLGSGGLFAFVEAAAGRRVALAQAAVWALIYVLYLIYTTIQIVYDAYRRRG